MGSDQKLQTLVVGRKKVEDADEEDDQPLSPATRLFHQPEFNCYIISIMGVGKKIDVDVVKAGVLATLVHHPRFSSLQVIDDGGQGKWVRTTVVVENHFLVPDLSSITITSPDQFVEDYISDLSTTTLDFSRPLWDVHLLNVRTSEAEAVAVLRCHHSLGDGVALMSLLLACFRKTSDNTSLPTIPTTSKREEEEGWQRRNWRWICFIVDAMVGVFMMVRMIWYTFIDALGFFATLLWLKDTETPIKGREGVEFNKKRFVHRTLMLDDVKFVKYAMDSTVNDVLLAITSAALTRYLSRKYGCDAVDGKTKLPDNIRIRSTVLVNIRKTPGIHALAEMMAGNKVNAPVGNLLGYLILPFPIVQRKDPLDYVCTAKKIANRKKASYEAFFTFSSAKLILKVFGIKVASSLSHKILSNTTLSFSNVIGPLEEVGFYGHPLVYIAPSVYGHAHSLTFHFQSYMGKMKAVLAVDESVIPDPHQLCADLSDSLDLMKNSAIRRGMNGVKSL